MSRANHYTHNPLPTTTKKNNIKPAHTAKLGKRPPAPGMMMNVMNE